MDELADGEIAEEEVEFSDGGVDVGLNLEVAGEEVVAGGSFKEEGEGVFVEVTEFLVEVEVGECRGEGESLMGEGGSFGEVIDEEGAGDEALEEGKGHWEGG